MISFRLFGSAELRDEQGRSLDGVLRRPKRLALLAYLALTSRDGFQRKDKLLAMFWPESDQARARQALRQALYVLRKELGDGVVLNRGDEEVSLNLDAVRTDVAAFEAALTEGREEEAVDLYRGEMLDGFHLSGAGEFERWLEGERRSLRQQVLLSTRTLLEREEAVENSSGVVRWAQRLLDIVPSDEYSARKLILHRALLGDRAGAVGEYEMFAKRLTDEFGVEPSSSTVKLVEQIKAGQEVEGQPRSETRNLHSESLLRHARHNWAYHLAGRDYRDALESAAELEKQVERQHQVRREKRLRKRRWHAMTWVTTVIAVVVAGAAWFFARSPGDEEASVVSNRVVVVPLENRTRDSSLDHIGVIAADWITHGLSETGAVEFLTTTDVLASVARLNAPGSHDSGIVTPGRVAQETGAGLVVLGSYHRRGDQLEFQVAVHDVARNERFPTVPPSKGSPIDPMTAIDDLRQHVAVLIAANLNADFGQTGSRPPKFDAYQAFQEGMQHVVRYEWVDAERALRRAIDLDSGFGAAYGVLGGGPLYNMWRWAGIDSVSQRMADAVTNMTPFERAGLGYLRGVVEGDRSLVMSSARRTAELSPGMARFVGGFEAVLSNRPSEALAFLRSADPRRGVLREWRPYWLQVANAQHILGDYRDEFETADQCEHLFPDFVDHNWIRIGSAAALGEMGEIDRALDRVMQQSDLTQIFVKAALELKVHGHPAAARRVAERAISWYDARAPEEISSPYHRLQRGQILVMLDRLPEAAAAFRSWVVSLPSDTRPRQRHCCPEGWLGVVAALRGDTIRAQAISDSLERFDRSYLFGAHTAWRARITAALGRREEAVELLRRAFSQGAVHHAWGADGLEFGIWLHNEFAFDRIRDYPPFQELMEPEG